MAGIAALDIDPKSARSVFWREGVLCLIDQRLLPLQFEIVTCTTVADVVRKGACALC